MFCPTHNFKSTSSYKQLYAGQYEPIFEEITGSGSGYQFVAQINTEL